MHLYICKPTIPFTGLPTACSFHLSRFLPTSLTKVHVGLPLQSDSSAKGVQHCSVLALPRSRGAWALGLGITTLLTWWGATGHMRGRAGERPQHKDFAEVGFPMSRAKGLADNRVQRMHLPGGTSMLLLSLFWFWLPWLLLCAMCWCASCIPHAIMLLASGWTTGTSPSPYLCAYIVVPAIKRRGWCSTRPVHSTWSTQGSFYLISAGAHLENTAKQRKDCALLSATPDWDCFLLMFLISAATSGVLGQHQQRLLLSHAQWKKHWKSASEDW